MRVDWEAVVRTRSLKLTNLRDDVKLLKQNNKTHIRSMYGGKSKARVKILYTLDIIHKRHH